jgi:hypothetical protein
MTPKAGTWPRIHASVVGLGICALAGLFRESSGAAGTEPGPGAPVSEPRFSLPDGIYTNAISLRLSAASPGDIRYTLDGSEPKVSSSKYSEPIELNASTLVRAKVFGPHSTTGPTVSQAYTLVTPELAAFDSNLPLIIINSFGQTVSHEQKVPVFARFIEPRGGRARMTGMAAFSGLGELNIRGHTSLRYPKHSYHFETIDETHHSRKVSLLGLPKESDWVLYGPYPDKTLMRDVLGYELSNEIGRYAARTRFVEVFLEESAPTLSARHYLGVYVFEEKIKRGKNRVDIQKLGRENNQEPNITGGYIFKKDHTDEPDMQGGFGAMLSGMARAKNRGFTSSQGNYFFYVEPKGTEITAPQRAWLRGYVNRLERTLYSDHFNDPKAGFAAFIDPDSFIDHHFLVEVTKNIDGFRFSTFYYKDRGEKLCMGPIWDWNLAFGNAEGREGYIPEGWYWPQLDDQQYSWFRRLFEDPDFAQKYTDRWGELRQNQFSPTNILARIDQFAQLLQEAQARNFRRWRILGREIHPNAFVGQTFEEEIDWMKEWVQKRVTWIDRQFLHAPSFSLPPGPVALNSELELKAPGAKIYYTLDGSDPRKPGGGVAATALRYSSPLVLKGTNAICCRALQDERWSYPAGGKFIIQPQPGS